MGWLRRVVLGASLLASFLANAATWTSPDGIELRYEESDDGAVIIKCYLPAGFSGGLEIPSTLGSLPVRSVGDFAFDLCSGLTSVSIPSSVTNIGDYSFSYSGLTSVTIPSSVTNIGEDAFGLCIELMSFIVAENNTEYSSKNGLLLSKDGQTLLFGVNGDVTIPDGVTNIEKHAFYGCSGLTSVTIPESVTSIGEEAFAYCEGLTSVTISEGVTIIGDGTFYCSGLTSVTIPSSVTSIGEGAFMHCDGLTSVSIPSSVTNIGDSAFYSCRGLTSVTIPKGVTSVGDYAFAYCTGLTSVSLPTGVTHVGEGVFEGCNKLGDVVWPSEDDEPQTGLKASYGPFVPGEQVSIDIPLLVGYAAKGLPAGLKFDPKTGKVTGAATKPTAEEGVKVTFTKRGEETLTTQFIVGPFPVLTVDFDAEMGKVTGAGAYAAGKKVTLKATAAKGYVFAGWFEDELFITPLKSDVDWQTPSMPYVMGSEDATVYAYFVPAELDATILAYVATDDYDIDIIDINSDDAELHCDEWMTEEGTLEFWFCLDSYSLPTVKVAGLPAGLKYDAKTMTVSGSPTKPGTYTVKVTMSNATVKNVVREFRIVVPNLESEKIFDLDPSPDAYRFVSGCSIDSAATWIAPTAEDGYTLKLSGLPPGLKYDAKTGRVTGVPTKSGTYTVTVTGTKKGEPTETATITVTVDGLPEAVAGTYIGYIGDSNLAGSFTLTATAAGKLTAKIVTAQGTVSFSAPSWSRVEGACDGWYDDRVFILGTGDEKTYRTLTVSVDAKGNMIEGAYCDGNVGIFSIDAAKNVFSSKWHFVADGSDGAWSLRSVPTAAEADLTVTLKDGMATASGKVGGIKVSGSTVVRMLGEGLYVRLPAFVTAGGKKGIMDIRCGHTGGDCSGVATLVGEF